MADILASSNRQQSTNRNFVSSILQRLPYVTAPIEMDTNNPKYELFDRLAKKTQLKLLKQSIITGPSMTKADMDANSKGSITSHSPYHNYVYANLDTDKTRRLAEYRRMASFAEVSDCIDEICDEFIVKDENNKVIHLKYSSFAELGPEEKTELQKEFEKFINIFDLEHKGWAYCRQLLIEGEVFFENITYKDRPDFGVIGCLNIPSELISPVYDNVQNSVIENFTFQKPINLNDNKANPLSQQQSNISPVNALQQQIITFQGNQVTYVNSGLWNEDYSIRIPFLENCRRAYKLLSLCEDAIIIYRLVRAPERLKFVIDVGNMPPAKAESYLRQLMHQYNAKQVYTGDSSNSPVGNVYNPQSMLDSYWFSRRNGEVGSDVSVLQGGENLGKLDDLNYFVAKLYKSLKVPISRLNPNESFKDGAEILREELKFAKFIMRLQNQFAEGLKQSFITHLKLRGWWEEYKLHESFVQLEFNPPSNYFAIRQQQILELKHKNFGDMCNNESISNIFAQRHYLGYNDQRISENMEWMRKEAAFKWELAQIANGGPNWREQLEAAQEAADAASAGGGEGPGFGGGGGTSPSAIPEFGGGGGGGAAPGGETLPPPAPGGGATTPSAAEPAAAPPTPPEG
jgi:hypothetical protein